RDAESRMQLSFHQSHRALWATLHRVLTRMTRLLWKWCELGSPLLGCLSGHRAEHGGFGQGLENRATKSWEVFRHARRNQGPIADHGLILVAPTGIDDVILYTG